MIGVESITVREPRQLPAGPVRRAGRPTRLSGLSGATLALCASLTPSLLPRTWVQQGVISGFAAVIGYVLGIVVGWLVTRFVRVGPRLRRIAGRTAVALGAPLLAVSLYEGARWQRDIDRLMGLPASPVYLWLGVPVIAAGVAGALLMLGRGLGGAVRAVARLLTRWIPPAVSQVTAVLVVALLTAGLLNGVVYRGLLRVATSTAGAVDQSTGSGVAAPTSPARSGSPQSLVSWSSLGMHGREFVSGGPSVQALAQFNGAPAKEPIRAYAGLDSAPTVADEAALAVRELRRTGAFSRQVLCVVTTTGTGWVDPKAAAALEYLYNGDTALVGIQYSYLPSWISFLVEKGKAQEAGRELFDQVYAAWSALPPDGRPRLLVFGESLGSMGSEAAFSGLDDISARADGVLWVGPTNANSLWGRLERGRDPGTPAVLPTYGRGRVVRFAAKPADLAPDSPDRPKVVYLQHASDPVVWWSPKLLLHRPDWLKERRGGDVLPSIRWYPFVTFLQLTADLVSAYGAPDTHGHRYGGTVAAAWSTVAPPPGWSAARTAQLTKVIAPNG
ncbi:hypothetical protein HC031_29945 [Planosporangium thailandense]|uniref:Alpha/beta-hydrolase family protein n=1 Tax=Planosporangium thailandense TaxID=765197 RepID=A0ABX0Y6F0_9ACTN|nr:alpha/beta-hydrolase family protein [Planosporangium thailandense]NJC73903.1 hypothetical protein [Planosporangium thailandense]